MNADGPVTMRAGRAKWIFVGGICAIFVPIAITSVGFDDPMIWLILLALAVGLVVSAMQLLPDANTLMLDETGFTARALGRTQSHRWDEIEEFGVIRARGISFVGYTLKGAPKQSLAKRLMNDGYHGWLPDTYGMSAAALRDMLELRRAAAVADTQTGKS